MCARGRFQLRLHCKPTAVKLNVGGFGDGRNLLGCRDATKLVQLDAKASTAPASASA
jgi:hypothetical protein